MKALLAAAVALLTFGSTPAMAAGIPYGDDNPENWGAAALNDEPFSVTTTDLTTTIQPTGQSPTVFVCDSMTVDFERGETFTSLEAAVSNRVGSCPMGASGYRMCAYSPSGFQDNDIELWIRWQYEATSSFAKATATEDSGNFLIESWHYDQQVSQLQAGTLTMDGTMHVNDGTVNFQPQGGSTCEFPELTS